MKARPESEGGHFRHARFDVDWLSLREPLDAASRSPGLTAAAAGWLSARDGPKSLVDLGSGTGSNARYLAPRLPGPQHWLLVDRDPDLLSRAQDSLSALRDRDGRPSEGSFSCRGLEAMDDVLPDGTDMVVASALLDLVSCTWLDALVAACARRRSALLVTLSVDGDWAFLGPDGRRVEDDGDVRVRTLFQAHQRQDKGLGVALAGEATVALAAALNGAGYAVETADSAWRIGAGGSTHRHLAAMLLAGWRDAALEQAPGYGDAIRRWHARRLDAVMAGQLGVYVGHRDLLAIPPAENGP